MTPVGVEYLTFGSRVSLLCDMETMVSVILADGPPVVVFVLFGLVAAAGIVYGLYAASKRRKALQDWAAQCGLEFDAAKNRHVDNQFPQFKCLQRGRGRYGYNFVHGDWNGRDLLCFDYRYTTGSGKNSNTHNLSAVILKTPFLLKPLFIRPEGVFDKVTEFFGYDDIDFESAEFSRKFYVKAKDKKWAYDLIHSRTMEFLLSRPKFNIKFDMLYVIAWKDRTFKPEEFAQAADVIAGVLDLLPDYVRKQLNGVSSQ